MGQGTGDVNTPTLAARKRDSLHPKKGRAKRLVRSVSPRASQGSWVRQLARALQVAPEHPFVQEVSRSLLDSIAAIVPPGGVVQEPQSGLTSAEAAVWAEGMRGVDRAPARAAQAIARTASAWTMLLQRSLTVADAAKRLHVQESRIRQRLNEGTLYGFKQDGEWRIPDVQFEGDGPIHGIDRIVPHIDRSVHPLAVVTWLTTPTNDLLYNGSALSPRDWLLIGGAPDDVVALATGLAWA
jgi:hypothetical protein